MERISARGEISPRPRARPSPRRTWPAPWRRSGPRFRTRPASRSSSAYWTSPARWTPPRKLRPDDQAVVRLRPRRARSRRGDEPGRLHQHVDARLREDPGAAKFRLLAAGLPAPPDGGAAERHRPRHADVPVPARSERRDSNAAGAVGRERRRRFPVAVPLPPVVAAPRPRGQGGVRMVEAGPHRSGGGDARLPLSRGGDASSFDSARPAAAALAALRTTSLPGVWGGVCSGTGSWSNRSRNSPAAARCSGLTGAGANAPGWTS